jgi:hypothetical protein
MCSGRYVRKVQNTITEGLKPKQQQQRDFQNAATEIKTNNSGNTSPKSFSNGNLQAGRGLKQIKRAGQV